MKTIWLIREGEPLPIEKNQRLMRTGLMAEYFSNHGYKVIWWTSTFIHARKEYYFNETKEIDVSKTEKLVLLHSPVSYKKNMSPKRIIYHDILAREMRKLIGNNKKLEVPNIIFCAYPTEQFVKVVEEYGKKNQVPVVIDARDQWPDIFERAFPRPLKKIGKEVLNLLKKSTSVCFKEANAICAMSPIMLQWALNYAGRNESECDRYIYIPTKKEYMSKKMLEESIIKWNELGLSESTWNICVFTNLSKTSIDMDTVIDAMKLIHIDYPFAHLVIGGKGDEEQRLINYTRNLPYVHMMGWMNQVQMDSLMSISKVGILPYRNTPDFKDGWGNKAGQYLSYGLPILTSAKGFAKNYLSKHKCGIAYREYDADNLANILKELICNPAELYELSKNAQERFAIDFEYNSVMKQFEQMISDVQLNFKNGREVENEYLNDQSLCGIASDGDGISTVLHGKDMESGGAQCNNYNLELLSSAA